MNPAAHAIENAQQRADALASEKMDFAEPDRAPEDAGARPHSMAGDARAGRAVPGLGRGGGRG